MLLGVDISNNNKWQNVYLDYDFVIFKASEGVNWKDPKLDEYYDNFHGSSDGKPDSKLYGFYHYARPETGNSAIDEADSFVNYVGHHAGHALFILDWEGDALHCSVDWAKQWLDRVYEKTGVKPLIYLQQSQAKLTKYKSIRDADYGLWVAQYGINDGENHGYDSVIWDVVAMHQFTSKPFDKSVFNGDETAFRKYCGNSKTSVSTTTSTTSKKSYFPIAHPTCVSIVDYLKACGITNVDFEYQTKVAKANGIKNYTGTYAQNVKLINLAKQGKLIKP